MKRSVWPPRALPSLDQQAGADVESGAPQPHRKLSVTEEDIRDLLIHIQRRDRLSNQQLADRFGVDARSVQFWKKGEDLDRIARFLSGLHDSGRVLRNAWKQALTSGV